MNGEDFDHHLNSLEQRFQALRDQADGLPGAREALAPALQEMAQALAAARAAHEAPGVRLEHSRQPGVVQGRCETFLHHDFEAVPDLLTVIDRDFNIVTSNWPRHDYVMEAEGHSYPKCYRVYAHRESPCEFCQVREVFATGLPYIREWLDPKAGRFREIYAFPILDEAGQVVLVAEHGRDIQERKEAEADLAEREEFYRALTEKSLAGVYLIQDGIFRYVNPVLAQIFGYTPEEMIGRMGPRDLTHPDDLPMHDELVRQRLAGEVVETHVTFRGLRRDGTVIHLEGLGRRIDYQGRRAILGTLLDITERKRAEEALREAEQKFRSIFDSATDGILIVDPETKKFHLGNPMIIQMLGYSQEELQRLGVMDIHPPDSLAYVLDQLERQTRQEFTVARNIPLMRKDGSIFYVDISASPVVIEGKLFLTGIFRDITERKRAEEALRDNEEKYRGLIETTSTGYVIIDSEGKVLDANPEYVRISGHDKLEEILGRSVIEWTSKLDRLFNATEVERCFRQGSVKNLELNYQGKDGRLIPVEINATVISTSEGLKVLSLVRDITERKQAEKALAEREELYRVLTEKSLAGVYLIQDGILRYVNPVLAQIFGYTPEEVIERLAPGDLIHPDDHAVLHERIRQRLAGEVEKTHSLYRGLRRDGTLIYVETLGRRVDYQGRPAVLGTLLDVTERQRAEETLKTQAQVLANMAEAVHVVDEDGSIVFANPAAYAMFGYPDGELTGQPVSVLNDLPPEESERFAREIIERLKKEGTWSGEIRNRTKDGIPILTYGRVSTLELPDKKLWVAVHEDITARKYLEEATEGYLQFIRLLLETIPNPIFYKDYQGVVLGCNKAFAEFLGVPQPEIPGLTVYDLFPEELAKKCDEMDQEALRHPETKVRARLDVPAADGSLRQIVCHKAAFSDSSGAVGGVVGIVTDITDLNRIEAALKESEERYRLMADNVSDVLWMMNMDYVHTYISPSVKNMTGHTVEEFMSLGLRQIVLPAYHGVFGTSLEKLLAPGAPASLIYEVEYRRKDNSIGWAEITITLMRDPHDLVKGLVGVARDITSRRRVEEALRESEVKYRELVENASCIILRLDPQGHVTFFNKFAQTFFGFPEEEIIGHPVVGTIVPEVNSNGDDLAAKLQDLVKHPEHYYSNENENMRRNGERVWVAWTNKAIYGHDGGLQEVLCIGIDRTDQMGTEKALKESEARYRTLFETAPHGVVLMDLQLNLTMANQRGLQLFGFDSLEEAIGRNGVDFIAPEDQPQVLPLIQEMFETGESQTADVRLLKKDGTRVPCLVTASFIRDAAGEPVAIISAAQDISYLKLAEEALGESEARLRAIFEHAPVGITMVDPGGRFLQTNPAYQEIVGYSAIELQNMTWQQLTPPKDLPRNLRLQEELLAGQRQYYSIEKQYLRKDGEIVWVDIMLSRLLSPQGEPRVVGTIIDITARKRAEEALRESEQRFRLMAENIKDVFWMATPGIGKTSYVSPSYEEIWGRTREELYQSPQSFLEAIHPEDREWMRSEILACHAQGVAGSFEYRIIKPDGEVRWIQDRAFPVRDEEGRVILLTGVARDITEQKTLEQQLLLAQKMEAVGRLAGGVAHDFNNLLMAIMGYGEIMQAKVLKGDPLYDYLGDILKATDRAAALTGQLLTFSRRQVIQPQAVDLNRVVLDLHRMLRRLIEEDIELKIITAPKVGAVLADPGQLSQIIMNLVINARDAMPCGGRIIVETAEAEFDTSHQTRSGLAPSGPYVTLEVTDSGVGMNEDIQAHIFEPFFTTKEPGKGTGLGLSTVYGIVKQSGGFIDLESEPGLGSTFTIYLPRLDAATKAPKAKISKPTQVRGQETILLVEDEDMLRALLAKFLRLHGYTVLEARHGGEALLICEQHQGPIHLLVTDVVMPQMSGRVLADRLTPLRPAMKVLYMSGYTEDEVVQRGVADLSVAFLQKPFKPVELAHQVHHILHPRARR